MANLYLIQEYGDEYHARICEECADEARKHPSILDVRLLETDVGHDCPDCEWRTFEKSFERITDHD